MFLPSMKLEQWVMTLSGPLWLYKDP
jgi:hypothetical protein